MKVQCFPCGSEVEQEKMDEHLRQCEKAQDMKPRTPFHGKPNEPITFKPQDTPKV